MNDHHFGVAVGIDKYPSEDIRDLKFACRDAINFTRWMISSDGGEVPRENIRLVVKGCQPITDVYDAVPRRDNVHRALEEVVALARTAIDKDPAIWHSTRLYVYLSGHGFSTRPREVALLMANATLDSPGEDVEGYQYIKHFESTRQFHELVFFADCCRDIFTGAPVGIPPWLATARNEYQVNSFFGYAANFGDSAYESELPTEKSLSVGRGYFTSALLEGLTGDAADPLTGKIDTTNLHKYVRERVRDLTKHRQNPTVGITGGDPIVFRSARANWSPRTHKVTIALPANWRGEITLLDGPLNPIRTYDGNSSPWVLHLSNGFYQVKPRTSTNDPPFKKDGVFQVCAEDCHVDL